MLTAFKLAKRSPFSLVAASSALARGAVSQPCRSSLLHSLGSRKALETPFPFAFSL